MQLNEQNKIALVKMSRNNKQPIERLFHWPIVDYTACSAHCTHTRPVSYTHLTLPTNREV